MVNNWPFSYFSLLVLLLVLLKLLYNICRVTGFEPEILRLKTGQGLEFGVWFFEQIACFLSLRA